MARILVLIFNIYLFNLFCITPFPAFAYIVFHRDGSVVTIKNSSPNDKNMIAFRQDGSIQVLSTKIIDMNLAEYVETQPNTAILGLNNEIETKKLIEANGQMRITRNQDQSVTVTILDQNNPDVVFENHTNTDLPQNQSLVYLEILPSPITISNEGGDLYLTQDVFKVKVDHEFDSFVIKSSPDNIFITTQTQEYKMQTQPLDVGRILVGADTSYAPIYMIDQEIKNVSVPTYSISSRRSSLSLLGQTFYCTKTYQIAFGEQKLLATQMPLSSRLFCLWSKE